MPRTMRPDQCSQFARLLFETGLCDGHPDQVVSDAITDLIEFIDRAMTGAVLQATEEMKAAVVEASFEALDAQREGLFANWVRQLGCPH